MKTLNRIMLLSILILFATSCQKNKSFDTDLPDSVEMNDAVIFLNGEPTENYSLREVLNREVYGIMTYSFADLHPEIAGVTTFGFDRCPRSTGLFKISSDKDVALEDETLCLASMSQTVFDDLRGQEFELYEDADNYLEITELDFENKFAKGHFKVKFRRTYNGGSGISDYKLPKFVTFEGIFAQEFRE